MNNSSHESPASPAGLSRRGFLALTGAAIVGAGVGAGAYAGGINSGIIKGGTVQDLEHLEYDFYGAIQSGIVTPAQENMHFAALDLVDGVTREDLIELLRDWSYAANRMMMGLPVTAEGAFDGDPFSPPRDTGEAADHGPFGLTITFGFGKSLFETDDGTDRFGIKSQLPPALAQPMPKMLNDFIDPKISGGDICIQACANDPQVAIHAIRNLTRIGFGKTSIRWSQIGFGRTSSTSKDQKTPRNLFGQKDGTNNIKAEEPEKLKENVWIDEGPAWCKGGSYLVARKIYMTIEIWDGVRLEEQNRVLGRAKGSGAPLSGGDEFTTPDFSKKDGSGKTMIDDRSHVFRTHPDNNNGIHMLRRGYNYVDGNDELGRLDAGLFFIAFVKSPDRFAAVHKNMARDDMFAEYLKTKSSSVFVVPPGIAEGEYVGAQLFAV